MLHLVNKFTAHPGSALAVERAWGKAMQFMDLTYAKMGITLEESNFDFTGRVRMTVIVVSSCSLTCL